MADDSGDHDADDGPGVESVDAPSTVDDAEPSGLERALTLAGFGVLSILLLVALLPEVTWVLPLVPVVLSVVVVYLLWRIVVAVERIADAVEED